MSKTMEPDLHEPSAGMPRPGNSRKEWRHPSDNWLRGFILDNRAALGTLAVFIVMMAVFMIANPAVFTTWYLYSSVLTTLPVALFVVVPLVFVVTCGEIDLSFPATMGFASWVFALVVQAGYDPFLGIAAAIATGTLLGFLVGSLVVYGGLSSLIATLGMNFLLRGLIQIINEGKSTALTSLADSWAYKIFSSQIYGIPVQIFWAIAFVVLSALLYNRHRFGAQVRVVGDNPDSAQQMGIDVKRVRVK
ncbi:ABC transporter permease, partial [Mesorhizobium sp.]